MLVMHVEIFFVVVAWTLQELTKFTEFEKKTTHDEKQVQEGERCGRKVTEWSANWQLPLQLREREREREKDKKKLR